MTGRAQIAADAMVLDRGQSMRVVGPFCGGGSQGERSMSIKLDEETGLVLYHCFRGNCEEGSGVVGGMRSLVRTRPNAAARFVPYDTSRMERRLHLHASALAMLLEWGIRPDSAYVSEWAVDEGSGRLGMSVWSPVHELRGYALRALDKDRVPKVVTGRLRNDQPFQCWQRPYDQRGNSIMVVEDIPSSIRVAMAGLNCLALLGNTPSDDALEELASEARLTDSEVVWALDADATTQALRLRQKYGMRGRSSVMVLHKDFKNMTNREVGECLMNVT